MKEQILHIPGFDIAYKSYGDPQKPLMLALHGWLDNAGSFDSIAPLFAKHFHILAIDLPGHGHSSHLPVGCHYHFVDTIAVIRDCIDALGQEKAHILGHSMGACIASLVGGILPDKVASLFLIEALGPLSEPEERCAHQLRQYFLHHHHDPKQSFSKTYASQETAVKARTRHGRIQEAHARKLVLRGMQEEDAGFRWRHDPRLLFPSPLQLTEPQVLNCLKDIQAPTALILANQGFRFHEAFMSARIDCIPHIERFYLDGGHHVHMEYPQEIYAIAQSFYPVT